VAQVRDCVCAVDVAYAYAEWHCSSHLYYWQRHAVYGVPNAVDVGATGMTLMCKLRLQRVVCTMQHATYFTWHGVRAGQLLDHPYGMPA
jgi:hypothetical protein